MAKDHYLPAAFIGRFSDETTERRRNRSIWIHNGKANKILVTTPSAVGYKTGLYNLANGTDIDKWSYEDSLNRVLGRISEGKVLSLDDYLRVAVPFVTGLFVRGKEFNKRYEEMPTIKHLAESDLINTDNTNMSRIIRLQRMLAPVTTARWVVLHSTAAQPVISNDLGLTLTKNLANGEIGWAIPLDKQTILGIFPLKRRSIAYYEHCVWTANIEHLYPDPSMFEGINEQIAKSASEFVFGPTRESVAGVQPSITKSAEDLAIVMEAGWNEVFERKEYAAHERDWQYLSAIANLNLNPRNALRYEFKVTDLDIKNKWFPTLYFMPSDRTLSPSGIEFSTNEMYLNMNLINNFEDQEEQGDTDTIA
jgi:hypothetical protein